MNCSTPGLPVHHQLPEFTQTHVHWVSDAIQPSHPLSSPSPPAPNPSQHQSLFQWVNSSHEMAKVLEFQLPNQGSNLHPLQWKQSHNHWTSREVPVCFSLRETWSCLSLLKSLQQYPQLRKKPRRIHPARPVPPTNSPSHHLLPCPLCVTYMGFS